MGYDKVLGGGGENVSAEVDAQGPLIEKILTNLVGKVDGANVVPEAMLEGYCGYRGRELVEGNLVDTSKFYEVGNVTVVAPTDGTKVQEIKVLHKLGTKPSSAYLLPIKKASYSVIGIIGINVNVSQSTGSDALFASANSFFGEEGKYCIRTADTVTFKSNPSSVGSDFQGDYCYLIVK